MNHHRRTGIQTQTRHRTQLLGAWRAGSGRVRTSVSASAPPPPLQHPAPAGHVTGSCCGSRQSASLCASERRRLSFLGLYQPLSASIRPSLCLSASLSPPQPLSDPHGDPRSQQAGRPERPGRLGADSHPGGDQELHLSAQAKYELRGGGQGGAVRAGCESELY